MSQVAEGFKSAGLVGSEVEWNTDIGPSKPERVKTMLGRDSSGHRVWGYKDNKADMMRVAEVYAGITKQGHVIWKKL